MPDKFPGWPNFSEREAEAVKQTILSNKVNYWTGDQSREFESAFAKWAGTRRAIALANGTLALDLAMQGLRIGARNGGSSEDEVIVTPRTFIASVSSVVNAGAIPVFADVDYESGNITVDSIHSVITNRSRAVIPVHLGGWPAEMVEIMALADTHGLFVIEDCAQAHGALISGDSVGSFGHVGAWSFCQDKIMTTGGEGGMITTNDEELWSRMWSFKDHGKSWDAVYNRSHLPGFRFVHESFGTNWRMMEVQAALGLIQLDLVRSWNERRNKIAMDIASVLGQFPQALRVPMPGLHIRHAFYRLYAYFRQNGLKQGWDRDRVIAKLVNRGVPVMHGTCSEVYLEKAFEDQKWYSGQRLENARDLGETSICFLVHPSLQDKHVSKLCDLTKSVLSEAVA